MLFVDNHVLSFAANFKNGVPITDFLGQKNDTELLKVMSYALSLSTEKNLMLTNEKVFGLQQVMDSNIEEFIHFYAKSMMTDMDDVDFDDDGHTMLLSYLEESDDPSSEQVNRISTHLKAKSKPQTVKFNFRSIDNDIVHTIEHPGNHQSSYGLNGKSESIPSSQSLSRGFPEEEQKEANDVSLTNKRAISQLRRSSTCNFEIHQNLS